MHCKGYDSCMLTSHGYSLNTRWKLKVRGKKGLGFKNTSESLHVTTKRGKAHKYLILNCNCSEHCQVFMLWIFKNCHYTWGWKLSSFGWRLLQFYKTPSFTFIFSLHLVFHMLNTFTRVFRCLPANKNKHGCLSQDLFYFTFENTRCCYLNFSIESIHFRNQNPNNKIYACIHEKNSKTHIIHII
jgi:hypothetical protein